MISLVLCSTGQDLVHHNDGHGDAPKVSPGQPRACEDEVAWKPMSNLRSKGRPKRGNFLGITEAIVLHDDALYTIPFLRLAIQCDFGPVDLPQKI
jgi:hypothetical protein